MDLCRRRFLHLAAGAAVLPTSVSAQAYPSRPVNVIVGQTAGCASDIVARLIAQFLSEKLGQQVLVEVRPVTWYPLPTANGRAWRMNIDDQDRILVAEYRGNKIARFDPDGEPAASPRCGGGRAFLR